MDDQTDQLLESHRKEILAAIAWSHRELTHGQLWRVLDAVKEERKYGVPVEIFFPANPYYEGQRPNGFEQAKRLRDQLAAADDQLPPEQVDGLKRLAFEGLAEQRPTGPTP